MPVYKYFLVFRQSSPTPFAPLLKELKTSPINDEKSTRTDAEQSIEEKLSTLENRLQIQLNTCVKQLQEHFDTRFDRLEEKLDRLEKHLQLSDK